MTFNHQSSCSKSYHSDPFLSRLLNRMSPAIVDSFSDEQLEAIRSALVNPAHHPVNIRLSIPLLFKRFYFVVLAGPERRSRIRLKAERFPLWTPANTIFLGMLLLSLLVTLYNGLQLVSSLTPAVSAKEDYPTALPWVESAEDCTGFRRHWKDGLCYDADHNKDF
jgi:hypothetical protein